MTPPIYMFSVRRILQWGFIIFASLSTFCGFGVQAIDLWYTPKS